MQKLREYPLCPSRTDKKRMVVSQLYEPSRDLEKLDLPIISWPMDVESQLRLHLTVVLEEFLSGSTFPILFRPKSLSQRHNASKNGS